MKNILVPTDFSEEAENALKVAAQLARKYNSEIFLTHILELPLNQLSNLTSQTELPEAMFFLKLAQQRFEEVLDKDYLEGLTIYEHVEYRKGFANINEICQEEEIDMIVMGSHGADGFQEMFIGSNAEKVVRNSKVPVLVIKNNHDNFDVDNLVFASDFNNDSKETYAQAAKIANTFGAKLHLLMVVTASNFLTTIEAQKRIDDFIAGTSFENYTVNIYNDVTVESGILNFSKTISADLIGISTHGRQGIAHFFNGSISEDLVNHAKRPVMTFKI
jgi:nucleotide-binding universal stress UspA family protein